MGGVPRGQDGGPVGLMTQTELALAQAQQLLDRGRVNEALRLYEQVIEAEPANPVAHSKRGVCLAYLGDLNQAEAEFRAAIGLDPRYAPAHSNLGNVFKERGNLTEAETCYRQALAIDSDLAAAHQNLGVVLKQQGHIEEAIKHFKTAIRVGVAGDRSRERAGTGNLARALRSLFYQPVFLILLILLAVVWLLRRP